MRAVTLFLCGDVMLGRGIDQILPTPSRPALFEPYVRDARDYIQLAERKNGPVPRSVAFDYVWGDALRELDSVRPDARIVNLETSITTSDDAQLGKQIHYRMHPSNVGCVTAAGIDVCVLANNHVLDWGTQGLVDTLDVLETAGVRTAGAGVTLEQAERPAIVDLSHDARVIVFAFGHESSGVANSWRAGPGRPGVAVLTCLSKGTAETIGRRIEEVKRPGDVVVASIHWGTNWGYDVPRAHVQFARALIDAGVDVVHGHSSHHPRPTELYRQKLILYGCGDFLNDYEGISGHEEYRSELTLMYFATIASGTGELLDLRLVPMKIRKLRLERPDPQEAAWITRTIAA